MSQNLNAKPHVLSEFLPYLIKLRGYNIDPAGRFVPNPSNMADEHIITLLYEDYLLALEKYNMSVKKGRAPKFDYTHFKRVIEVVRASAVAEHHSSAYAKVSYDGRCSISQLNQYVTAVVGYEDITVVNVLAHWIANIKRKMQRLPVTYQLMPVFTGKQKGGKSTAIRRLISPLGDMWHETTLTAALKTENFMLVSQYYAIFFDEMEGVQKSSIAAIKKMITEEKAGGRMYYTQRNINTPNIASFIGTSNEPLLDLIDDKTGARRFFEVKCADKIDWEIVNSLSYESLWRSIDETIESKYYLASEKDIDSAQQALVSVDMFQLFINETHILPGPQTETEKITSETMYKLYCLWLEPYKVTPLHPSTFFKKLLGLGFQKSVKTLTLDGRPRRTYNFYYINKESQFAQDALRQDKNILTKIKREEEN